MKQFECLTTSKFNNSVIFNQWRVSPSADCNGWWSTSFFIGCLWMFNWRGTRSEIFGGRALRAPKREADQSRTSWDFFTVANFIPLETFCEAWHNIIKGLIGIANSAKKVSCQIAFSFTSYKYHLPFFVIVNRILLINTF